MKAAFSPEQIARIIDTALAGDWLPTIGQHRVDVGLIPKPLWWGSLLSFTRDTRCQVVDAKRARRRHLDLAAAVVAIRGQQIALLPDTRDMLRAFDPPRAMLFPWYANGTELHSPGASCLSDFRRILRAAKLPIVPWQLLRGYQRSVEAHRIACLSPVTVTIPDGADVDADPMALAAEWADAAGLYGTYRRKNISRLQSLFLVLDVYRVRDIEPGLFARFLRDEVKRDRLTADTASLYRVAALGFVRWLIVNKRLWNLARVAAELDAARVGQCAIVRERQYVSNGRPMGRPRKATVTA